MAFGLAEPETITKNCERFKSILANFIVHKQVWGKEKTTRIIPGERFAEFVIELCRMFDEHFNSERLPPPTLAFLNLGTSGTMAQFGPELWQVAVNDSLIFTKDDVPVKFAPVVFSSIYHEYRHAEQFSVMIRYAWAQDPKWLQFQNVEYSIERNQHVPQKQRVPESARFEAFSAWELAARKMSDQSIQEMINRSLSTVGGARVSLKAVRSLRLLPLGRLPTDTQEMTTQAALWFQSRFRTWAEEFGGRTQLFDPGKMIDADETTAANTASADAKVFGDAVDAELKEWNQAKPIHFPNWPISISVAEGKTLHNLRTAGKAFNAPAAKACHAYLTVRRRAALDLIRATQDWYEGVPLESDTHSLESQVAKLLKLSAKTVDKVAKTAGVLKEKYLPVPKDWSLQ